MGYSYIDTSLNSHRGRGMMPFTLIELLVVIAVTGILVSLLLPALTTAKWQTKNVVCINNLKQMTTGATSFTSDNDEEYPWRPITNAMPKSWNHFQNGTNADIENVPRTSDEMFSLVNQLVEYFSIGVYEGPDHSKQTVMSDGRYLGAPFVCPL